MKKMTINVRKPSIMFSCQVPEHIQLPSGQNIFIEEYNDMVTFLSQVKGLPDSHYFQPWMCWYMNIIRKGNDRIDWGEQISDAIFNQLKEARTTLKFYVTSYLVYVVASMRQFPGLSTKGDRRQTLV